MRPVSVTGVGVSPPIPLDIYLKPFSVSMGCIVTGTATYSVQWTLDDVWSPSFNPATANWFAAAANLTAATTSQAGSLVSPVTALQLVVTAGTGTVQMRVAQAGVLG